VQLALSSLVRLPGIRAFHSSVLVDGREFWFSHEGLCYGRGEGMLSHKVGGDPPVFLDLGESSRSGQELAEVLGPMFRPGTYDMLHKNCNTFSDAAMFYLLRRRMSTDYLMLDKLAAAMPSAARVLMGSYYSPNPNVVDFDVEALIKKLGPLAPESPTKGRAANLDVWPSWLSRCARLARPELCIPLGEPFGQVCPSRGDGKAHQRADSGEDDREVIDIDYGRREMLTNPVRIIQVQRSSPGQRHSPTTLNLFGSMQKPEVDEAAAAVAAGDDNDSPPRLPAAAAPSSPICRPNAVRAESPDADLLRTPRMRTLPGMGTPRLWSAGEDLQTPRTSGQLSLPPELLQRLCTGASLDVKKASAGPDGGSGLRDDVPLSARAALFKPTLVAALNEVSVSHYADIDSEDSGDDYDASELGDAVHTN